MERDCGSVESWWKSGSRSSIQFASSYPLSVVIVLLACISLSSDSSKHGMVEVAEFTMALLFENVVLCI